MCLAVPMRITAIDGPAAVIEAEGLVQQTSLMLVPDARVGDFVLVHAGFAIAVLDDAEAAARLDLFDELTGLADAAPGDDEPPSTSAPDDDPRI
ncbi:MAG TPA: HypC/HybG/HupF family hydrogenase formation chaperone [Thermoleophilia bacterium]|nr:HypC/HybG/HupF family hydrogenase formation chaperone [Thermoleophilia bacterium]